ncbi:hypothetical protein GOV12_02670 [Candidatus Pacearchaeota archaeon]|nr:hypothetical protein [Candidatus Pacearchaeota archaeon]
MVELCYAVYVSGGEVPIGALRESTLEAVDHLSNVCGLELRTEPITLQQYADIRRNTTNRPESQ